MVIGIIQCDKRTEIVARLSHSKQLTGIINRTAILIDYFIGEQH
jgi:hypothetical protein